MENLKEFSNRELLSRFTQTVGARWPNMERFKVLEKEILFRMTVVDETKTKKGEKYEEKSNS